MIIPEKEEKLTKEKLVETEVIIILDRSGSMSTIGQVTVDGFNEFLNEQRNSDGEAFLTLVQFDTKYQMDYKSVPMNEVQDLVYRETFVPRGMTAMYDAIGKTINELETDRDVVCVIITDGCENASREYTGEAIKKIIPEMEKKGWKFLFLGANQDAVTTGGSMGINSQNSMTYGANTRGVSASFGSTSKNIKSYRSSKLSASKSKGKVNTDELDSSLNFNEVQRKESDQK